jgi:DNA-binding NarL/FixJ family response regulator
MSITILLVDDHKMFRDGLRNLISREMGLEPIGEAKDGDEAIVMALKYSPDVMVMDLSMPGLNGLEATRKILEIRPQTKIIVLSMHSDRRFVVETLKVGAKGYVLKDSDFTELVQAIHAVVNDRIYLSQKISDLVIKDFVKSAKIEEPSAYSMLSAREREVLQQLAEGKGTKVIADHLNVSIKTIETYRKNLMDKLDLHSIAALTKYAIREGITPLE